MSYLLNYDWNHFEIDFFFRYKCKCNVTIEGRMRNVQRKPIK